MSVKEDFLSNVKETRAMSGYGSAWLVKEVGATKYSLVTTTESVPYVFGDTESFEYDILQASTKGQVKGKPSLEPQDIEVLHHRDNAYRFEKLSKQGTLDFMTINGEKMGYKFNGTLAYKPNNAEADVSRATVTITPMSADVTPVYDARPYIAETLTFASSIPATIKSGAEFDISVDQTDATVTYKMVKLDDEDETDVTTLLSRDNPKKATISTSGIYAITVSDSTNNYAPWTTTVYVEA